MVEFIQEKPLTIKIFGGVLLGMAILLAGFGDGIALGQLLTMSGLGLVLLGYSLTYEIHADYGNKRSYNLFGLPMYKTVLKVEFPDYISLFSARVGKDSGWGPIAAMGGSTGGKRYTVRMFKGRQHFTLYRSTDLEKTWEKSASLGKLLNVPVKEKIH